MKTLRLIVLTALVACGPKDYMCIDAIEEEDLGDEGLEIYVQDDFVGQDVCFYGVTRRTCEKSGGEAVDMSDAADAPDPQLEVCAALGYSVRCSQVGFVADVSDCPTGYTATIHE